jgi:hypothetical protein
MPGLTILDSFKQVLTSYSFGNVVAGTTTLNKLLFVSSTGVGTASGAEFGIRSVTGNDAYGFTQIDVAEQFDASGSTVTGTATSGSGSIAGASSLMYAITTIDAFGYESGIYDGGNGFAPSMTSGTDTYAVDLSWDAVSGAATYGVYLSTDSGAAYKKITETTAVSYTDTSGSATTDDPAASGTKSYRPAETWISGTGSTIDLGDMAEHAISGVYVRETVASGTTSAGNPRQHYIYTKYTAA